MRRPSSVRIAGRRYRMMWIPGIGMATDDYGSISEENQTIAIDPDDAGATLIHELAHGLETSLGHDLGEVVIGRIERAVFALTADNPGLLTWIDEAVNGQSTKRSAGSSKRKSRRSR